MGAILLLDGTMRYVPHQRHGRPPDPSRWYVEAPAGAVLDALAEVVPMPALRRVAGRLLHLRLRLGSAAVANLPCRVYADGSAYVVVGEDQEYIADWSELWDAGCTGAWERYKRALAAVERTGGAGR